MDAIGIARSGLSASMMRLTASASNIANAQSAGAVAPGPDGQRAYQPVRAEIAPLAGGGAQARLAPVDPAYRLTYAPSAPYADARGMVATPNVDIAGELVEQLSAKLAFEANLKVIATAEDLARRTTTLWG